jgi:hypothetical protein
MIMATRKAKRDWLEKGTHGPSAKRTLSTRGTGLQQFVNGYIQSALWSSTDNSDDQGGEALDQNYDPDDIAPATRKKMFLDATAFYRAHHQDFHDASGAGHDFWLTRNGHGAGFWDRPTTMYSEAAAERLTKASEKYGTFDLYVGDDGQIHGDSYRRGRPSRKRGSKRDPRKPKGDWALIKSSGMDDAVLSTHATEEAAEGAMRKRGGEPHSMFTKSMRIVNVGPLGKAELIHVFGKWTTRPR